MGQTNFKDLTTFKVGGVISEYREVATDVEIIKAAEYAAKKHLPVFFLGGGSDILVSDNGFNGMVLKHTGKKIFVKGDQITAAAGASWDALVEVAVKNNLSGVECLSGIPGTVGASPVQNIGAYGQRDNFFR